MKNANQSTYQINGRVIDIKSGRGIGGLRVEAWDKDLLFNDLVGSAVTDAQGRFRIEFSSSYYRELFFDNKPDLFFKVFSGRQLIKSTQDSVLWNVAAGVIPVEIAVPWAGEEAGAEILYTVSGTVTSSHSAATGGLRVEIVDRNVGQDTSLAETTTEERGNYLTGFAASAFLKRDKKQPDLQARVYIDQVFIAASEVRYNASANETLNVTLPAAVPGLPSEYETLTRAVARHYDGRLADLKESEEQRDITYLANKTGWDARAVALAALAEQFSNQSGKTGDAPAIKPAFYYAMFRAGLPANSETLYQAAPQMVERVWEQAIAQRVIPAATSKEIEEGLSAFRQLGVRRLLTGPALAGASSLKDMLRVSRLAETQQQKFAELYAAHRSDLPTFWTAVENEFDADTARKLQVDGKLGLLTINNAHLMQELHNVVGGNGVNDPVELALHGFHRAAQWNGLLSGDVPVPPEIPGETAEAKKLNYAEYLATQVRVSYPTASLAHMIKAGDIPVQSPEQVQTFLTQHQDKFEIGIVPVEQYIARNELDIPAETLGQVKRLERVFQITPNDEAMAGLMRLNLDAAYHVVQFEKETFTEKFALELGGTENAALTYDRSMQVSNAVLNIAVSYLTARNGIGLGAAALDASEESHDSGGQVLNPVPSGPPAENAGDVIAYPTLERLFGEMDFCACDHCRSILSPAAYLVDLLHFINKEPLPTESGRVNPQTVLLEERRPDIQHLPLTCENTNTALPYIDVVNETLEYFIANSVRKLSLRAYVGHDTKGVASEDLLASPQFVMDSAYTTLADESFPSPLPFHRPLEILRRYFTKFEVPLTLAMERLRKSDALERGADTYGRRDIRMEELGFSRAEYKILTDSVAIPLAKMYGFADGTPNPDVITALSNAKSFSRLLTISYDDLVAILRTRFVNPLSDLIPKLERLKVPFAALKGLKDNSISDAQFDALLPQDAAAPDPAEYDGDIKAWVRKQENFDRIMRIITLTNTTADANPCNFENLELRHAQPMASLTDTTTQLDAAEFTRILRFIRIWKKLGWSIEQTDTALCALFPLPPFPAGVDELNAEASLDAGCSTLIPRLGIVKCVLSALNLTAKRDLLSLLACWSPLGTHGEGSLYRQMFLNPALLNQDAVFADNGYGEFLQDDTVTMLDHREALRAAFGSTDNEFSQIAAALGFSDGFVSVHYNHASTALAQPILDAAPGIGYDDGRKLLTFTGALNKATRDAAKLIAGVSAEFQAAMDALYLANKLTIGNITAVYRRSWLARKLKLSVRELLLLTRLTNLDPFTLPDPANPAILNFIDFVQMLRERNLKSGAALYLIWNQDLSGRSAPDPAQVTEFARTLRGDFSAINEQFAAVEDPGGDIARARMTLVYGQETADAFFALLDDTVTLDVPYAHASPTLEPAITAVEAKLTYDDFRHRLTHTGVLSAAKRDALKGIGIVTPAFRTAVDNLFARNEDASGSFFARHPELKPLYDNTRALELTLAPVVDYTHSAASLESEITTADPRIAYNNATHRLSYSGVLTATLRDKLKAVPGVAPAFAAAIDGLFALSQEAKGRVLAALQPELSRRRKRQQTLQRFSAAAGTDLSFTQTLLDSPAAPYPLHAFGHLGQPALNDVLALETPGLAAQFFFRNTATGVVDLNVPAAADLNYAVGGDNPLPANPTAGAPISGIWSGQIETVEAGYHNFVVEADAAATVTLSLDGQARALTQNGNVRRNTDPLELKGGTLYEIVLTVNNVRDALSLKWETPKRPREVISGHYLYPPAIFSPFSAVYTRFLKATSLALALRLTGDELSKFATDADYRIAGDGWLNALAVVGDPDAATAAALLKPFYDLLVFSRIKSKISPDDDSLLKSLQNPSAATLKSDSLLFTITGWDKKSLDDLLTHFGGSIAGLARFGEFRRVYDAFALIEKMGVSASALIQATTNEPTGATVRDLNAVLRSRYEAADWRGVIQPINDQMRGLQRDALVAYILHQMRSNPATEHLDTPDKLFEYFLMDVEMEPCMQTSRIRHALSSVQLFIERCLMNLEPRVSPTSIVATQWEWMKRYRVWEANRKVFLFPENWLEPELRDDKSSFFKEIESELLQSDITEDSAATALLNYLTKLEEVALLEPCGIHHVEGDAGKVTDDIEHVIARTSGAHRKYFYRRREFGYWTPWEQIKVDIEDNPVIPVVWNDRLLLFWVRILKQAPVDPNSLPNPAPPSSPVGVGSLSLTDIKTDAKNTAREIAKVEVQAVLCWSEYYNGKWQPAKTSDIDRPASLGTFVAAGPHMFDRSSLQLLSHEVEGTGALCISISGQGGASFFLYNTHSLPLHGDDAFPLLDIPLPGPDRGVGLGGQTLDLFYTDGLLHFDSTGAVVELSKVRRVLANQTLDTSVEPRQFLENAWTAPFFYKDSRHLFYVTTATEIVSIDKHLDYGVSVDGGLVKELGPLPPIMIEVPIERPGPKFWGDGDPVGPDLRLTDPAPIRQFLSEDVNIHQVIGTMTTVRFGTSLIGPAGGFPASFDQIQGASDGKKNL